MELQLDYDRINNLLSQHHILSDAAEVQGILCGMLCAGMSLSDQQWQSVLADCINEGERLPDEVADSLNALFNQLCQQFVEADYALQLLLPDDASPINDRGLALIHWVQGFLLGFGLRQENPAQCSDEVREALNDFSEIARMEEPMSADEASERALQEVVEYVKISALYCYSELGQSLLDDQNEQPKLH